MAQVRARTAAKGHARLVGRAHTLGRGARTLGGVRAPGEEAHTPGRGAHTLGGGVHA
jgi:hypothetical protein